MTETNIHQTPFEEESAPRRICKNCGKKMGKKGKFCPHCGQKDFDGKIRLGDLFERFFHSLTHLDSQFVRMVWQLFIPAKVTLEYFSGKIKRYPNPVQFFFVVMFFFLLMLNKTFEGCNTGTSFGQGGNFYINEGDSLSSRLKERDFSPFDVLKKGVERQEMHREYDRLPAGMKSAKGHEALDSVFRAVNGNMDVSKMISFEGDSDSLENVDSTEISFFTQRIKFDKSDFVRMTPDELIKAYQINGFGDQMIVRQSIKSMRDPQGLIHAYIGSIGWTTIALITVMSFILYLLYWRRKHFYVEHFIFLMHFHAGGFLLLTLVMLTARINAVLSYMLWVFAILWIMIAFYIAMLRYYKQSRLKTFVKWSIYMFLYTLFFSIFLVLGLIAVFAVF